MLIDNYINLIKWLIGIEDIRLESIDSSTINEKKLLQIVLMHKLESRVLRNKVLEVAKSNIVSNYFIAGVAAAKYEMFEKFNKQKEAIKEIMDAFQKKNIASSPIIIKGLSIFGLTGDDKNRRKSVDIDLLYSDMELLTSTLTDIGYVMHEDQLSDHEFCSMEKGDIVLDLHRYIPVLSYTDEIRKKIVAAQRSGDNIFFEVVDFKSKKLDYYDLLPHSIECNLLSNALVPDSNLQILILSSHTFRDYIMSQFHPSSGIILSELIDIVDLMEHSSFDEEKLKKIVYECAGWDSISLIASLLENLLDNNRLSLTIERGIDVFPKSLFWSGVFYIPGNNKEYIYYEKTDILEHLKYEKIFIEDNNNDLLNIANIYYYNSHGIPNVNSISLNANKDRMIMKFNVPTCAENFRDNYKILIDNDFYMFIVKDFTIVELEKIGEFDLGIDRTDDGYCVIAYIPINSLNTKDSMTLNMIICITRWGCGPLTTFLPVQIMFQDISHSAT